MPNKRNPIGCAITLAAAQRTPGLVASFLSSMVQEHERAVGGWQAEWPIISGIIQATGVALQSMAEVAEGLEVDSSKMTANIQATQGTLLAEHAMMLLTPALGRERAQQLAKDAAFRSLSEQRNFAEVLSEMPEAAGVLNSAMLEQIKNPAGYLGSAEALRRRLLASTSSAEHQDHHPTEKE
jgi:3-carboxy-cis,cis-muconate cycloisomerase